jgi:hypothetical protein
MINVDEKTIKQILLLLKPFQHIIKMIQTGNSPSLYMVLLCIQTLNDVTSSYQSLLNYDSAHGDNESNKELSETDDDLLEALEGEIAARKYYVLIHFFIFLGITFFLNRIRGFMDEMFTLDVRHYAATLLHPKYRSLKSCSVTERSECHDYIRRQLNLIYIEPNEGNEQQINEPAVKKFKGDLFRRFESDVFDDKQESGGESVNESEEYSFAVKNMDELDRYLNLVLEKTKLPSNPLFFWKEQQEKSFLVYLA